MPNKSEFFETKSNNTNLDSKDNTKAESALPRAEAMRSEDEVVQIQKALDHAFDLTTNGEQTSLYALHPDYAWEDIKNEVAKTHTVAQGLDPKNTPASTEIKTEGAITVLETRVEALHIKQKECVKEVEKERENVRQRKQVVNAVDEVINKQAKRGDRDSNVQARISVLRVLHLYTMAAAGDSKASGELLAEVTENNASDVRQEYRSLVPILWDSVNSSTGDIEPRKETLEIAQKILKETEKSAPAVNDPQGKYKMARAFDNALTEVHRDQSEENAAIMKLRQVNVEIAENENDVTVLRNLNSAAPKAINGDITESLKEDTNSEDDFEEKDNTNKDLKDERVKADGNPKQLDLKPESEKTEEELKAVKAPEVKLVAGDMEMMLHNLARQGAENLFARGFAASENRFVRFIGNIPVVGRVVNGIATAVWKGMNNLVGTRVIKETSAYNRLRSTLEVVMAGGEVTTRQANYLRLSGLANYAPISTRALERAHTDEAKAAVAGMSIQNFNILRDGVAQDLIDSRGNNRPSVADIDAAVNEALVGSVQSRIQNRFRRMVDNEVEAQKLAGDESWVRQVDLEALRPLLEAAKNNPGDLTAFDTLSNAIEAQLTATENANRSADRGQRSAQMRPAALFSAESRQKLRETIVGFANQQRQFEAFMNQKTLEISVVASGPKALDMEGFSSRFMGRMNDQFLMRQYAEARGRGSNTISALTGIGAMGTAIFVNGIPRAAKAVSILGGPVGFALGVAAGGAYSGLRGYETSKIDVPARKRQDRAFGGFERPGHRNSPDVSDRILAGDQYYNIHFVRNGDRDIPVSHVEYLSQNINAAREAYEAERQQGADRPETKEAFNQLLRLALEVSARSQVEQHQTDEARRAGKGNQEIESMFRGTGQDDLNLFPLRKAANDILANSGLTQEQIRQATAGRIAELRGLIDAEQTVSNQMIRQQGRVIGYIGGIATASVTVIPKLLSHRVNGTPVGRELSQEDARRMLSQENHPTREILIGDGKIAGIDKVGASSPINFNAHLAIHEIPTDKSNLHEYGVRDILSSHDAYKASGRLSDGSILNPGGGRWENAASATDALGKPIALRGTLPPMKPGEVIILKPNNTIGAGWDGKWADGQAHTSLMKELQTQGGTLRADQQVAWVSWKINDKESAMMVLDKNTHIEGLTVQPDGSIAVTDQIADKVNRVGSGAYVNGKFFPIWSEQTTDPKHLGEFNFGKAAEAVTGNRELHRLAGSTGEKIGDEMLGKSGENIPGKAGAAFAEQPIGERVLRGLRNWEARLPQAFQGDQFTVLYMPYIGRNDESNSRRMTQEDSKSNPGVSFREYMENLRKQGETLRSEAAGGLRRIGQFVRRDSRGEEGNQAQVITLSELNKKREVIRGEALAMQNALFKLNRAKLDVIKDINNKEDGERHEMMGKFITDQIQTVAKTVTLTRDQREFLTGLLTPELGKEYTDEELNTALQQRIPSLSEQTRTEIIAGARDNYAQAVIDFELSRIGALIPLPDRRIGAITEKGRVKQRREWVERFGKVLDTRLEKENPREYNIQVMQQLGDSHIATVFGIDEKKPENENIIKQIRGYLTEMIEINRTQGFTGVKANVPVAAAA